MRQWQTPQLTLLSGDPSPQGGTETALAEGVCATYNGTSFIVVDCTQNTAPSDTAVSDSVYSGAASS